MDLVPVLRGRPAVFIDFVHLSAGGYALVADSFAEGAFWRRADKAYAKALDQLEVRLGKAVQQSRTLVGFEQAQGGAQIESHCDAVACADVGQRDPEHRIVLELERVVARQKLSVLFGFVAQQPCKPSAEATHSVMCLNG